jgi:hypothetical protein
MKQIPFFGIKTLKMEAASYSVTFDHDDMAPHIVYIFI